VIVFCSGLKFLFKKFRLRRDF